MLQGAGYLLSSTVYHQERPGGNLEQVLLVMGETRFGQKSKGEVAGRLRVAVGTRPRALKRLRNFASRVGGGGGQAQNNSRVFVLEGWGDENI